MIDLAIASMNDSGGPIIFAELNLRLADYLAGEYEGC
jgi:hypothetical protein